ATASATARTAWGTRRPRAPGTPWCREPTAVLSSRSRRARTIRPRRPNSPPGRPPRVTRRCRSSSSGCAARSPETRRRPDRGRGARLRGVACQRLLLQVPRQLVSLQQGLDIAEGPDLLRFALRNKYGGVLGAIERGVQAHSPHADGRKCGERERYAAYPDQ